MKTLKAVTFYYFIFENKSLNQSSQASASELYGTNRELFLNMLRGSKLINISEDDSQT